MRTIKVPIYGYKVVLAIGEEHKKVVSYINARFKKLGEKLNEDEVFEIKECISPKMLGFFLPLHVSGYGLLWVSSGAKVGERGVMITLSHEINHLCIEVFDFIHSEVNAQTQEPFCYLHDHVFEKCLAELDKTKINENDGCSNPSKESDGSVQ